MLTLEFSTKEEAQQSQAAIEKEIGSAPTLVEKRLLSGDEPSWILAMQIVAGALPGILTFLGLWLRGKERPKSITYQGVTIKNPSAKDIELLLKAKAEPKPEPKKKRKSP